MPTPAPGGAWKSPLTARAVAASSVRLGAIALDGNALYWIEGRPEDGGRQVVVGRRADRAVADLSPATANVRSRVQEYGGAAYTVVEGVLYYVEFSDQRIYTMRPGGAPVALTPPGPFAYADLAVDPRRPRLVCVREDHSATGREAETTLVSVAIEPSSGSAKIPREPRPCEVIAAGHDFYASPRFDVTGAKLAWIAWRHPQMPWDGTELWVAEVAADGTLTSARLVAGGTDESIVQPGWSADGRLYFMSDRSGWWNLYCTNLDRIDPVCPMDADCARPMWQLGMSTWAFAGPSRVVVAAAQAGRWRVGTVDLARRAWVSVPTDIEPGDTLVATPTHVMCVGGTSRTPDAVVRVNLDTGHTEHIRRSCELPIDVAWLSQPRSLTFPTEGGASAHAFFYPPTNPEVELHAGERPPLLVICHGGPTAATSAKLSLEIQYWTTRGFAVVDVNYGGSASYGRAYRKRLEGQWGIVDVADAASAARFLVDERLADPERIAIRGRSAGGYTTLAALVSRPEMFKAGASYYGIGDLELLVHDTHKFEARYLDGLIGPYPESRRLCRERSPIDHLDRLASPLILFQGLEDRVVPPNQARLMADAVRAKGSPVALLEFPGEQHGFRRAETIARCLEAELAFYGAIFGFDPPDVPPLSIDNLDR